MDGSILSKEEERDLNLIASVYFDLLKDKKPTGFQLKQWIKKYHEKENKPKKTKWTKIDRAS